MPELEKQIAGWRKRMAAGGVRKPAVLDELESHLREEIRSRLSYGDSETVAFQTAAARIGSAGSLRAEFSKISGAVSLPVIVGVSLWLGATLLTLALITGKIVNGKVGLLFSAHALTILSGYVAVFVAGGFGILYVCWRWSGRLSPSRNQALSRAVWRFNQIAAALVIVGFLLGEVWARQHPGTLWASHLREIGGLCCCVWLLALCLMQSMGKLSDHARMLLSIVGNIIVGQAWIGVAILMVDPTVHWYGVTSRWLPFQIFIWMHLFFLFMGFSRRYDREELTMDASK